MARRIAIIGGGIAGLCAALGLRNAGFEVRVFEQASAFGNVGAGITLGLTAMRGLDFLGVGGAVRAAADIPKRPLIAHYRTGKPVEGFRNDDDAPVDPSTSFYQIHRADLHRILFEALSARDADAVRFDRELAALTPRSDGVGGRLVDGGTIESDGLVGCDGLRSRVRGLLFDCRSPRFTGQVAWRFLIPAGRVGRFLELGESVHYIGPGRSLLRYLVRRKTLVNCVAFVTTDRWTEEGWSVRSSRKELLEHFEGWNDDVLGLIRNAPADGIFKWALFDREPLPAWSQGAVTLAGDAAHPMLPFLGLGAAIAIEDAVVLTRACMAHDDIRVAFQKYETARSDRAARILLASRKQGEIFNSVDPDAYQQTDRPTADAAMYAYDPATQELP